MTTYQDSAFAKSRAARQDYYDFVANTTATGPITQITDAPEEFTLNPLDPLINTHDFDIWLDDATRILRQLNLHRFLDQDIERPDKISPHAARWVKTSKKIQAWLFQSIPKEINRLVQTSHCRHDFADEYIALLKKVLDFTGYTAASRDIVAFWNLRRSKFSSPTEFVSAFRDTYAKMEERVPISPAIVGQILLHEIESDNPTMIATRHSAYEKRFAKMDDFKAKDLFTLFNEVLNELRKLETMFAAVSVASSNTNNGNKNGNGASHQATKS